MPSTVQIEVAEGGLGLQTGLDEFKMGPSGQKLVIELWLESLDPVPQVQKDQIERLSLAHR
jgi:hypothetical protein